MAQSTIPLYPFHNFPQLAANLIVHEVRRVERTLGSCCYADKYFSCRNRADVSDVETGCGYCFPHFRQEVALG